MNLDIQFKIKNNSNYTRYLRENSYWYKNLNRDPSSFTSFVEEVKDYYKLRPTDKFNQAMERLELIQSFLEVLR